jgi:hypothetical protein
MTRRFSSSDGSVVTLTATTVILPFGLQLTRRKVTSGSRKISRWRRDRLRSTQSAVILSINRRLRRKGGDPTGHGPRGSNAARVRASRS